MLTRCPCTPTGTPSHHRPRHTHAHTNPSIPHHPALPRKGAGLPCTALHPQTSWTTQKHPQRVTHSNADAPHPPPTSTHTYNTLATRGTGDGLGGGPRQAARLSSAPQPYPTTPSSRQQALQTLSQALAAPQNNHAQCRPAAQRGDASGGNGKPLPTSHCGSAAARSSRQSPLMRFLHRGPPPPRRRQAYIPLAYLPAQRSAAPPAATKAPARLTTPAHTAGASAPWMLPQSCSAPKICPPSHPQPHCDGQPGCRATCLPACPQSIQLRKTLAKSEKKCPSGAIT